MGEQLWSSIERKCFHLLQKTNSRACLLQIHAFILRNALETNVNLLTKFISTCTSLPLSATHDLLALLRNARQMFDKRPQRDDSFLCNCMINAHVGMRQFDESFTLYRDLRRNTGFVPNSYTLVVLAKSCSLNMAIWEGQGMHSYVVKTGFCSNLYVLTALLDMYAKFGKTGCARTLFDEMSERSKVSWTALVCGYARSGDMTNARKLFDEMPEKDSAIYNAMIDGYAKLADVDSARDLFEEMTEKNVVSWTSMIHGYCHSGNLLSAKSLFDAMPEKNLISWNTMISGYCQNKQPHEALKLFHKMQATATLEPNEVTLVSILPAIADLGAMYLGCWVHHFAQRKKYDGLVKIRTALIDMYAKCGEVKKAKRVFEETPENEISSWNALINGFAINGRGEEALELFLEMQRKNLKPNEITMLGVLSACNHSGLVQEGKRWFKAMDGLGLIPHIEHYGCMVDLLGRAGCLEEAEKLIERMPCDANGIILSSFLSACSSFKDVARSKKTLKNAAKLEPGNDGNYVTVRNLYAAERRWSDAEEIKRLMRKSGANKEVGCSVIEIDGTIWEFISRDRLCPNWDTVDLTLGRLWKHMKGDITSQK